MKALFRILSLLLAVVLIAVCLPLSASAVDVSVGFSGADLVLSDSIGIRFYADKATVTGARKYVGSYATLSFDVNRDGTPETVTIEPEEVTVGGTAYFRYTFVGIAPDKMGETVTAQLHIRRSDGQIGDGQTVSYAVKDYVLHTAGNDAQVDVLLADLIAYGRAAEAYTGESTLPASGSEADELDALVSAYAHTEEVATTAASNARRHYYTAGVTAANAKVTFTSVGLNLRDNAAILYAFAPASGEDIADYSLKVKVDDVTYTYGAADFEKNAGTYLFRFRELLPTQMESTVEAWFVNGSGTAVSTGLRYSVASYVYQCWCDRASEPVLNALTQALLRYGNACDKYFNEIIDYFDVDAAFAASGRSMTADNSDLFPAGEEGYRVNGGPYLVDYDTIFRLAGANVAGDGSVKWKDYRKLGGNQPGTYASADRFDGVVPVSKLNDPLFMSTALPSEATTYMSYRVNATNMYPPRDGNTKAMTIGAIYRNQNDVPADDQPITICIRNFRLLYHSAATGWIMAHQIAVPTEGMVNNLYNLPWNGSSTTVSSGQITRLSDHVEIALTGADFNGKSTGGSEACLHIWAANALFSDFGLTAADVDGIVSAYECWVKEPEAAGKVVCTIGCDLRPSAVPSSIDNDDVVDQVFSGRNYLMTTQPRWALGHNVGPAAYDTVMDTETVQSLIGLN